MKAAISILAIMLCAAPAAAQSPGAEALGRELAQQGMLMQLLPLIAAKETEEMVAGTPGLSDAETAELRATARQIFEAGTERILTAQASIYAEKMSVADLQALVDFNRSDASKRYRAVLPVVIQQTMSSLDGVDFKGETLAAFCKKTGKGCKAAE